MLKKIMLMVICIYITTVIDLHAQTPPAPTHVNAGLTGSSATSVNIDWTYMPPYTTYQIWRATGLGGTYTLIYIKLNVTNSSLANYTDTNNIQPAIEYCYKVKTCDGNNCSNFSYADCYTTPDIPPPIQYTISGTVTYNGSGLSGVIPR